MILLTLLFATVAFAKTVVRGTPKHWVETADVVDPNMKVAFRLAIPQKNVDVLAAETIKRATPSDPMYGEWFTPTEVMDLIAPDPRLVEVVVDWARSVGLSADGTRRDIVLCEGTVAQVERALQTRLSYWQHEKSPTKHLRTLGYTIPDEVHEHIELLAGLTEFWPRPQKPKMHSESKKRNSVSEGYVIPDVLRKLYNIPKDTFRKTSLGSSICVAEFQDDASYAPSDLTLFDKQTGEDRSHVSHRVGPFSPSQPDAESQLDIEYASTLALNSTYWFWTVTGWMMEFSNDLFTNPGPLVVSMSWGWPEDAQCQVGQCNGISSRQYTQRVDTEWLKITSTGVTLLAASGDQGSPGDNYADNCNGISDIFPGASPWILSVGATMFGKGGSKPTTQGPPACKSNPPGCATTNVEVVCSIQEALITSGGGFSSYEKQPAWQQKVVQKYLSGPNWFGPPLGSYNTANRAFPDVSAMGHAVLIGYQGSLTQVDGTSCSSPIVGAMIALLNGWRINNMKKPLGFINPVLYAAYDANPAIFKDIVGGNNGCSEGCCGTYGFPCVAGWDAATGLGAIHFDKLLAYVQKLK